MTTLHYPPGVDSSFMSTEVRFRSSRQNPTRIFQYKVISDTVVKSIYRDSALTYGLILPASALVGTSQERIMTFGTDSTQCHVVYANIDIYKKEEQSSILLDIILPPDKKAPDYDKYKTNTTTYARLLTGTARHPFYLDEIKFHFEFLAPREFLDSADVTGFLKIVNDSFVVRALYNVIPLHGKNVKPMQILQGYSLLKSDTAYGFLQHAPLVKSKDVVFISPKLSGADRMLVVLFLSLISQTVYSSTNQRIF